MNLVLFAHPQFLNHQSMPRYAGMLAKGMSERGHTVKIWSPKPRFYNLPSAMSVKKWLGYIDQFIIFPIEVRRWISKHSEDTLFVFTDHALGPWVRLVCDRPHVIHCHDFLAQRSALGEISENPVGFTGRLYQKYIRRGYSSGKHFISSSENTKKDLHRFLSSEALTSDIVYNGLNQSYAYNDPQSAREVLSETLGVNLSTGFLLHVGGNAFYKNRVGIVEIYTAWRTIAEHKLPLLLIGEAPSQKLLEAFDASPFKRDIHFFSGLSDELVRMAYSGATVFLFPSLAEGFGWPIAEAMASGCPVITTKEAPMTEVAGTAGFLIPRRPFDSAKALTWAQDAAATVNKVVELSHEERKSVINAGLLNAQRFDPKIALDRIEAVYKSILDKAK